MSIQREFPKLLAPEQCGASQLACTIVNNTFLSLDGFAAMRKQMEGTEYTAQHFGAELARIVDRELSTVNQELLSLVRSAFDRFTDNDMQPPNNMLREWLDSAQSVIAKATRVAESNAMRHITVYMSDGDIISTNINGTDEEIMRHYLGNRFEAGSDTKHHVALAVHFHDTDKTYGLPIKAIEMGTTHRVKTVRRVTVCVDETKTIEEFMITTQGGAEFALDDVWVYNLNGEWIKGIGYKHATAETMYVANNSEHGYLVLDKDFGWRYTQDKTKATKNIKSEWDDIARQLTHRFKLIAI